MRVISYSLATFVAVLFLNAAPASAKWTCVGPEYVCGPSVSPSAHKSPRRKQASYAKRAKPSYKTASRRSPTKAASRRSKTVRAASKAARVVAGSQTGVASYYWQGQRVASGGRFNPNAMTAAHRHLPFGTRVRVTNLNNGRSVDVTINDRGPFIGGRIIDLSRGAAGVIGMRSAGLARVRVDVIGRS